MPSNTRNPAENLEPLTHNSQAPRPFKDDGSAEFPQPTWTFATEQPDGSTLPQIIAHRGYKAMYPENSMAAFRAAVEAGVHCIETDVHVTRDGNVVLSHDANLRRCFGKDLNIINHDWAEMAPLLSTRTPHEPMPQLVDLLQWLAKPARENVWLLLDIKPDVNPTLIISLLATIIGAVAPHPKRQWAQRIVLGVWGARYLPLVKRYLPGYAVTHITFSTLYSRVAFLPHQYVGFSVLAETLALRPLGEHFVRRAHAHGRAVVVWTINEPSAMRQACQLGVDGVITDEPQLLAHVCEEWRTGRRMVSFGWRLQARALWFRVLGIHVLILLLLKDIWAMLLRGLGDERQ